MELKKKVNGPIGVLANYDRTFKSGGIMLSAYDTDRGIRYGAICSLGCDEKTGKLVLLINTDNAKAANAEIKFVKTAENGDWIE